MVNAGKNPELSTEDILSNLRKSLNVETTDLESKPFTLDTKESPKVEGEIKDVALEEKDIRVFYLFLSDYLKSRSPKWAMSDAEIDNFTLLTVKLGEKYSAYYLKYSLEATAFATVALFVVKRMERKPKNLEVIPE